MKLASSACRQWARGPRDLRRLALYRLGKGSYPENLLQLSPQYIGQVPEDFFVGPPLRYEWKETGYLLYSQGRNRGDDSSRRYSAIVFQVPLPPLDED